MGKLWSFIRYNNAIPIALFVLFGGAGATFAASPEARDAVYSSYDEVQSVDNTYIVSADLSSRDFHLRITGVQEDDEHYYISYTYNTISIIDYIWQEVQLEKEAVFSKKELFGKDLGLFVARQLGEEITQQLAYLTEVQQKEREKGATVKRIATEYSGLIGRMFDPTEKSFSGYVPVVEEQPVESGVAAAALARPGESRDALPPLQDIQALVAAAVAQALAQNHLASSTTEVASSTEPNPDDSDNGDDTDNNPPSSGTSTPPVATSTPPVATSTPSVTPPATTTPPVQETPATTISPEPEPEPEPELEDPTPEPEATPEPTE